jgi:hypothetical protein
LVALVELGRVADKSAIASCTEVGVLTTATESVGCWVADGRGAPPVGLHCTSEPHNTPSSHLPWKGRTERRGRVSDC